MDNHIMREKLCDYIRFADEKKVEAIYTMLEKEILQNEELWDDSAFLSMLEERTVDYEKDRTNMSTWEEVKAKVARLKD